jgi:hypothetical protein
MKAYLVWDNEQAEGVIFAEYEEAKFAATGWAVREMVSPLADDFRKNVGDDVFKVRVVDIPI